MTAVETPPQLRSSSPSLVLQVLRFRELAIVVAILLVFGVTVLKDPSFANALSIQQLLAGPAIIGLLAVGETLVIVTRNVDLSVGSVLGLSAYLVGDLFVHDKSITIIVALLYGLLIGVGCGLVNGVIVAYARVPSLVVTLGTLYIIRGVTAVIVNGIQINPTSIPQSFLKLGSGTILGIPYIFIITTVAVVVVGYVMRNYRAARDLYAIGSNPEAAVLAGIPVPRRILSAFVISGALAGLGGAIWLAEFATVASTAGIGRRAAGRLRCRGRRGGHFRRERDRARCGARGAALEHDRPGSRRIEDLVVLEPGHRRRDAAACDLFRPIRLVARRAGPSQGGGRAWSCLNRKIPTRRWARRFFLSGARGST